MCITPHPVASGFTDPPDLVNMPVKSMINMSSPDGASAAARAPRQFLPSSHIRIDPVLEKRPRVSRVNATLEQSVRRV
ncbi:hypothetical protein GCM10009678_63400 [Actinomadura kijaniata]